MKRTFIAIALFFYSLAIYAQSDSGVFKVNGRIEKLDHGIIYFSYPSADNKFISDSCEITGGRFEFTGNIPYPVHCYLQQTSLKRLDRKAQVLYLEAASITIELTNDPLSLVSVQGSKTQDEFMEWKSADKDLAKKFYSVLNYSPAKSDSIGQKIYQDSLALYNDQKHALEYDFIKAHPQSYVIPDILVSHYHYYTVDQLKAAYHNLAPHLQASSKGKYLLKNIATLNQSAAGSMAVNILSKDYVTGESFDLSQQKGKYVMVDFWGSWCQPCLKLLPNVVEEHKKWRNESVQFVSVALDDAVNQNKCREIVKTFGMSWVNLWASMDKEDPNSITSVYDVHSFPTFMLIDPTGKILAKAEGENGFFKCKALLENSLKLQPGNK